MSFTVSIVNASGAVVGTKTISSTQTVLFPSLTIGGSTVAKNYSAGIPINSPSQILVFSGLYGGPYQVRISNVKTNYPCKTVTATSGQYQCGQVQAYDASGRCYTSFYYAPWGSWLYGYGVANKDFLTSNYTCCLDGTLYEQFQNARCGVGAPFTNDNWTFSLIEVETETTACLN
jgi:hypothetical protein